MHPNVESLLDTTWNRLGHLGNSTTCYGIAAILTASMAAATIVPHLLETIILIGLVLQLLTIVRFGFPGGTGIYTDIGGIPHCCAAIAILFPVTTLPIALLGTAALT